MKLRIVEVTEHDNKKYVIEEEYKTLFGRKKWRNIPWNIIGNDYVILGSYEYLGAAEAMVEKIRKAQEPPKSTVIKEYEI